MGDLSNPLQWELQQLELLHDLARRPEYNWKPNSMAFKKRVKLIQQQSLARQTAAVHGGSSQDVRKGAPTAPAPAVAQVATKRAKPLRWEPSGPAKGKKFSDFTAARAMLGKAPHGEWRNDRDAPSGVNWRRFISYDKDTGAFSRARIIKESGMLPPKLLLIT